MNVCYFFGANKLTSWHLTLYLIRNKIYKTHEFDGKTLYKISAYGKYCIYIYNTYRNSYKSSLNMISLCDQLFSNTHISSVQRCGLTTGQVLTLIVLVAQGKWEMYQMSFLASEVQRQSRIWHLSEMHYVTFWTILETTHLLDSEIAQILKNFHLEIMLYGKARRKWTLIPIVRNVQHYYRPRSEGDNALGSVRRSVCLSVRLCALSQLNRLTYECSKEQ